MKEMKVAFTYRHKVYNRLFLVSVYYRRWVCSSGRGINLIRTLTNTAGRRFDKHLSNEVRFMYLVFRTHEQSAIIGQNPSKTKFLGGKVLR